MLLGEYDHQIDEKSRMFLPAKMREECGGVVYVVRGVDKCIAVYPEKEWMAFAEKLQALPQIKAREIRRKLLPTAERTTVDSHGRILLPQRLREYASLEDRNVKVLGVGDYAELWNPELLAGHESTVGDEEMIADLIELGF